MLFRSIANTDLKLSEIGFGCMSLGERHDENERLIHRAIVHGINYFDTADLYQQGFNEASLGRAIKGKREEVLIATKVGNEWDESGSQWRWNPKKSYILKAVNKSLKRLNTDYIDLYQLHGGTLDDPIDEVIEAFEILRQQGKIRYYGLSSIRPNVVKAYVAKSDLISDMLQYSMLDRRPEEQLLPMLAQKEKGVLARGVLAKGFLAGKRLSDYLNYDMQSLELLIDKLQSFSIEKNHLLYLSIQWVLLNPAITSCVIGFRNLTQLEQVLEARSNKQLSAEDYRYLCGILNVSHYANHRVE